MVVDLIDRLTNPPYPADPSEKRISRHDFMALMNVYKEGKGGLVSKAEIAARLDAMPAHSNWNLTTDQKTQLSAIATRIDNGDIDPVLLESTLALAKIGVISQAEGRTIVLG